MAITHTYSLWHDGSSWDHSETFQITRIQFSMCLPEIRRCAVPQDSSCERVIGGKNPRVTLHESSPVVLDDIVITHRTTSAYVLQRSGGGM